MTRKWVLLSFKALVSIALIVWIFQAKDIDAGAALDRIGGMAPGLILPAAGAFLLQILFCSLRWRSVLRTVGASLDFVTGFRLMYVGAFFYQTLPASVGGDVVRTFLAYRLGVPLRSAVNGILLERVLALGALVLLVAAVQPVFLPRVGEAAGAWMAPVAGVALAGLAALVLGLAVLDRLPQSARRWAFVRGMADLAADTRALFLSPRNLLQALGWAVAAQACLTTGVYLLARGLGLDVGLVDCFALFLPVLLLSALPVTVAGWGLREGGMVYAFGLIGVPGDAALVLSVLYGLFTLGIALPGGLIWLTTGLSRAEVKDALSTMAEPLPDSENR